MAESIVSVRTANSNKYFWGWASAVDRYAESLIYHQIINHAGLYTIIAGWNCKERFHYIIYGNNFEVLKIYGYLNYIFKSFGYEIWILKIPIFLFHIDIYNIKRLQVINLLFGTFIFFILGSFWLFGLLSGIWIH